MLQAGETEPLQKWLSMLVRPSRSIPEVAEASVTSMKSLGDHECAVHNLYINLGRFMSVMPRSELTRTSPNFSTIFLIFFRTMYLTHLFRGVSTPVLCAVVTHPVSVWYGACLKQHSLDMP